MCPMCGQDIGEDTIAAAEVIYGPAKVNIRNHLRESLEAAARNVDTVSTTRDLPPPLKDQAVGEAAVLLTLGLADFDTLARAYRHYGDFYECRR
jgi:hypothetical protein